MMANFLPPYFLYPLAFLVAAVISLYAVNKLIFIARHKRLYDIPDNVRKIHGTEVPSLGGIGIFAGYIVASSAFMYREWYFIVAATTILFLTGIYDDIMNMRPSRKLMAQLLAATIAVLLAGIRISDLYGLLGIHALPEWLSIVLTIFLCAFFINVFNFVDGIDGLACTLSLIYTIVPAIIFTMSHQLALAGTTWALCGAILGLFWYNKPPARIYMGDTGSMMLGFTIFVLVVLSFQLPAVESLSPQQVFTLSCGLLFLPVFDALRVFVLRLRQGTSPLHADRRHLHHYLLDSGYSHARSVSIIAAINVINLGLAWLLRSSNPGIAIFACLIVTSISVFAIDRNRNKRLHIPS